MEAKKALQILSYLPGTSVRFKFSLELNIENYELLYPSIPFH